MIAFLALLACAYEAPVDPERDPMLNGITGSVTYATEPDGLMFHIART